MGDPSSSPEAVVKEGQLLLRDLGVLMDHGGLRTAELTRLRRKIEAVVKDPGREKRLDKVWEQVVDGWQILADALQAEMEALASDTLVLKRELSLDLRGQAERQLPTILPARTEQAQEKLRHLRALLDEAWKLQGSARRRYAQGARRRVSPKASTAMTNFYYRTPRRPAAGLEEERLQLLDWEWWKEPADRRKKVVVELGGVKAETELIRLRANTTLWLLGDPMRAATRLQVPLVLLPDRVLELTITLGAERAVLDMPFASQPGDRKKAIPYPAKGKPPVRVGLGRQPSVEDYPLHRVQIDPDDRNVSRSHLELVVTYDRSVGLRDSSSKNGTWVPVTFLKEFGAQPPEVLLSKALQGYVAAWNAYQPYLTEPVGSLVGPTRTAFETLERMMKRAEQGLKVVLADQFGSDQEAERWLRREEDARRRFPDGYSPTVETLLDAIAGMSQDGSAAGLEEEFREKVMALKQYGEIRRFLWSYWARGQGGDPIPLLMAWRREPARWKLQLLPGQAIEVFHWMLGFLESFPPDRPDYRKELFAFFRGTASDQDSWGSVRTAALHGMRLVGPTDEDEREILEVADALWKETLIWSHRKGAARGVIQSSLIRTASHLRVPEARSWLLQKKNERALRRAAGPSTAGQRPVVRPPSAEAAGLEELPLARLNELDRFLYETTAQFAAPRAILADAAEDPRVAQLALALSLMMAKDGLYEVEFRLVIQESYASGLVERLARVNRKAAEEYLLPRIVSFDGRTRTYADAQAQALEVLARRFGYESAQHLQQSGVLRPVRILTERLALDLKAFLETGGLLKFTDEAFERFQALLEAA